MSRLASVGLLVCGMLVLAGCSDDTDPPSQKVLGASGAPVSLNGTWVGEPCATYNASRDQRTTLRFSGSANTATRQEYAAGGDCEGDAEVEQVVTATATIGAELSLLLGEETVVGSREDLVLKSVQRTVFTEELAAAHNEELLCGFGDWVAGEAKVIYEPGNAACTFTGAQRTSLFIDDEGEPDRLYATNSTSASGDYPATLLATYSYARQ